MRSLIYLLTVFLVTTLQAQQLPVNCDLAIPGCSTPSFAIVGTQPAYNTVDFTAGSISNPSSNPQGVNSGCLLSGETVSTFITINVVTSGTLEWSIIGTSGGCFDWIMWADNPASTTDGCAGINNNTLPPVACNWNGTCNGNTGMAAPGNIPPNGSTSSYQPPLNVTAGQSFILCLSNYSFTNQNVNLNFFGTSQVVCGVSAADQTICQGASATVNIATPGYTNPSFQWLVTNGVSNTTSGTNVTVTPTVTTTYQVRVTQPAAGPNAALDDTATFTITVVPPPTPNAGIDQTVCLGQPISLSASPAGAGNTVTWNINVPPGMTPPATASFAPNMSSPTPTVTVNQPGVYNFIWRETNTTCGIRRDTVKVTVVDIQLTATPTHPSCGLYADGSIQINSATATEYSYDGGTTWVPNNTQGGFTAGTYSVCARNAQGCSKCINTTLVDPVPVILTISNDTLICENGTATLVASATGGTSYTFNWGHTAATSGTQQVSPAVNTYYPVVAENQAGCLSQPDSILVSVRPPISAALNPLDQFVCPGYPGTINAINVTGGIGVPYSFVWSNGFSNSGSTSSITESPNVNTMYTVTIEDGCESSPLVLQTQILVRPLPVPLIGVDEPEKCEPAQFILTNLTDPAMNGGVVWNISDGQQFINQNEVIPADLYEGTYDVQLIVTSPDGCIDSTTFNSFLLVRPQPVADFRWSPDPITMFNTQVMFQQNCTGADTYGWTFQSALPGTSNKETPIVTFPDGQTGYYEVTLIAYSDLGCSDTVTKIVPVLPEVILYAPNAFTPDGDEFNQTWFVHIAGIDPQDFELLVYNRWGQIVWESKDPEGIWDGTYLGQIVPPGTYTWTIRTKDMLNDKKYEWQGALNVIR